MAFVTRDSCTLYYETLGEVGPWLTLINGHTRSSRDFRLLAGNLARQGLRCLLFDNRGSGETVCNTPFTLKDIAEDAVFLWNELGIQASIVMGLSMGGIVSQILQHLEPHKVRALILVSTGSSEQSLSQEAFEPWGQTEQSVERKLQSYFTESFMSRNKILVQAMAKQILIGITSDDFVRRAESQREAMRGADTKAYLNKIDCPTLIIHGTDDRIIPFAAGEQLHSLIPGSELRALNGIGHLVLAEYSKNLAQDVLTFVKGLEEI